MSRGTLKRESEGTFDGDGEFEGNVGKLGEWNTCVGNEFIREHTAEEGLEKEEEKVEKKEGRGKREREGKRREGGRGIEKEGEEKEEGKEEERRGNKKN